MTCSVSRLKAQRGKPKAKHIESELLSAVVRTATPAGCRSPVGERGSNTDFTGWPSTEGQTGSQYTLGGKAMNEKALLALRQSLRIIRRENDVHRARIEYYETVGMLRGLHYGGAIDSWQLLALTELAGSAYINAGKPW